MCLNSRQIYNNSFNYSFNYVLLSVKEPETGAVNKCCAVKRSVLLQDEMKSQVVQHEVLRYKYLTCVLSYFPAV